MKQHRTIVRENGTIRKRHRYKTKIWVLHTKYNSEGKQDDKNTESVQNSTKIGYGVPNTLEGENGKIRMRN